MPWAEFGFGRNDVPDLMQRGRFGVQLFAGYLALHLAAELEFHAPRGKTNELKESFSEHRMTPWTYMVRSSAEHAMWVKEGTGVYGENGSPIRPEQAKAIKFFWDKIGLMTVWKGDLPNAGARAAFRQWAYANGMQPFTKWPRGMKGRDYVKPSIWATEVRSPALLSKALRDMKAID